MDWKNSANTHVMRLLNNLIERIYWNKLRQFFHCGIFIHNNLHFLWQFPIQLIPNSKINRKVFNVKILVRNQFDGNLSFLNQLLLFHWFLSVNFANLLWNSLSDSELMRLKLNSFELFKNRNEFEFDFTGFKETRNGDISNVLKFVESVEDIIRSVSGKEELDTYLIGLSRYSIIEVELSACDESGLLECDLKVFEFPSWFGAPFEYELIGRYFQEGA